MNKFLITGSAGFIGSALALNLLNRGEKVVGIDNHNNYYDPKLKEARLKRHLNHPNYQHYRVDIGNREKIEEIFQLEEFDYVINLAAQAGVRYSLENPFAYIDSNLVGFFNILEFSKVYKVKHFVYASSSSIYGLNSNQPFSEHDGIAHPVSLYAATKKANELIAHSYSHLYNLPTSGLRFFTVYGPYDRPDMALQKFAKAILSGEEIQVFNFGNHKRDFTYIDDIVEGIIKVVYFPAEGSNNWNRNKPDPSSSSAPYKVYNIGNNKPVSIMSYIEELEKCFGMEAKKKFLPIQPGDVEDTYADIQNLSEQFGYKPKTSIKKGIAEFAKWYQQYY